MKHVWVLMENDYPMSVHSTSDAAESEQRRLYAIEEAKRTAERGYFGRTWLYYHYHEVPLAS